MDLANPSKCILRQIGTRCLAVGAVFWLSALGATVDAKEAGYPVSLSFRTAGEKVSADPKPALGLAATVEYKFFGSFLLGAKVSYARPYTDVDDYFSRGMNDATAYVGAGELWRNVENDLTLSAKLSFTAPTSDGSRESSMLWAAGQNLGLKKGWGHGLSTTYGLTVTEYDYKYLTAVETDERIVYNTRFSVANQFSISYKFLKSLEGQTGAQVQTFRDHSDQTYDIFSLSAGLTWAMNKSASFDFGVDTFLKDPSYNETWAGPPVADRFFGAKGTLFHIGTTIKI